MAFDPIQVLWTPAGERIPDIGARALVDVSDGDTPNIRMPIRMLSVDTPEVTARSDNGAANVDAKLTQLAVWIVEGKAPVSEGFAEHILPKLQTGNAGTLQYQQGRSASAWFKQRTDQRLTKPNGRRRNLFVSTSEAPFDNYHRILAYVAPSYSSGELAQMNRKERATFNLDLVESGWAAPFIIFPNIPGELDLPLFLSSATGAIEQQKGQYAQALSLPAYEYRMMEKLYSITKKLVEGSKLSTSEKLKWRSRYAADMRSRVLHGPESYMSVPPQYRIWIWPEDVQTAIAKLNLRPAPDLVA